VSSIIFWGRKLYLSESYVKFFRREIMMEINIGMFNEIIDFERGLYEKI